MKKGNNRAIILGVCAFLLIALLFIGLPIFINFLYSQPAPLKFLETSWKGETYLLYIGGIISALGTCGLGLVTLYQTKLIKAKEFEKESAAIKRPFLVVDNVQTDPRESGKWGQRTNGFCLHYQASHYSFVAVKNIGDGVANNLVVEPWGTDNTPRSDKICVSLQPNNWFTIPILLEANSGAEGSHVVTIFYENLVGYAYSQKLEIRITHGPNFQGIELDSNGKPCELTKNVFVAELYNIYPQKMLGLDKFLREDTKYQHE